MENEKTSTKANISYCIDETIFKNILTDNKLLNRYLNIMYEITELAKCLTVKSEIKINMEEVQTND